MLKFDKVDWPRVLPIMGISDFYLKNHHGPCPICFDSASKGNKKNSGRRRFRFDNKGGTGTWFCSSCGSGNGFTLIQKVTGLSSADILKNIEDIMKDPSIKINDQPISLAPAAEEVMSEEEVAKNRAVLNKAWNETNQVTEGDPVWRYLTGRIPRIVMEKLSKHIRSHPGMVFKEEDEKGNLVSRGKFWTMLARVIDSKDKPITLHRTYLTRDGKKAPFEMVKKQMSGVRKLKGAAVRLNDVPGCRTLGATEGIETGLGVMTGYRHTIPVWAFLNANNLAVADIPRDRFDKVVIFADHDQVVTGKREWKCDCCKDGHRPGWHYATQAKIKLEAEGFEVEIKLPEKEGWDFADVWKEICDKADKTIEAAKARASVIARELA